MFADMFSKEEDVKYFLYNFTAWFLTMLFDLLMNYFSRLKKSEFIIICIRKTENVSGVYKLNLRYRGKSF